jgi:Mg-chelatase subunit ChlI
VILKASRAHAAFEGRDAINPYDIALAAELALPHRVKAGPFRHSEMGVTQLQEHIEELVGSASEGAPVDQQDPDDESQTSQKKSLSPPISKLAKNPLDPSP